MVIGMKSPRAIDSSAVEAEIAVRAYEKWLARGRSDGSDLQDWLEAEAEIGHRWETARRLTQAEERLLTEHAVGRILSASNTLSEAGPQIIHAICESLGWDVGEIWLVDRNANVLRCFESWHTPNVEVSAFEQEARKLRFSPGSGMPGRVWARRSPVWVPDMTADAHFSRAPIAAEAGLHAAVGIPIVAGTEFLGVITFFSRKVRQPDEELIETMNSVLLHMIQFVERRQAEEKLRWLEHERRIAREIQQGLLPKSMPRLAGFKISGRLLTVEDVGGDCFDFIPSVVDGREYLDVLIADASGHGIAAALLMAETRAYVRALALTCSDLGTLLGLINTRLAEDLASWHFVTLFLMRLDPQTRSLLYASAGHWPAYVLDRQGHIRATLASESLPIGIDSASDHPTGPAVFLEPGDLIFLFTDGIVEAASTDERRFGLERTLDIVRAHQHESPDEILEALLQAVSDFSEGHLQDDVTAVVIQVEDVA